MLVPKLTLLATTLGLACLLAGPAQAVIVDLQVDFSNGGAATQPGFIAQGAADSVYAFGTATVTVDLPAAATTTDRGFATLASSGSSFVADGAEIGFLAQDFSFTNGVANAFNEIRLSGVKAGTYDFEAWYSDRLQNPGLVFQLLEFSTDGGSTFATVNSAIDPSGLNATPVAFTFVANGLQDVVIRSRENNGFNQLRLNAFAVEVGVPVPEPATLSLLSLALGGIVSGRRRRPLQS